MFLITIKFIGIKLELNYLLKLIEKGENEFIEYKSDFPVQLILKKNNSAWEKGKGILLKDIVAMANVRNKNHGYLIYGIKEVGAERQITGIKKSWDDAMFQVWSENTFHPPLVFNYSEIIYKRNTIIGVFEIGNNTFFPHVVKKNVSNVLFEGQIWFRRGSKNTVAGYNELKTFFDSNPYKIDRIADPVIEKITDFYSRKGEEIVWIPLNRRDYFLNKGYELAHLPNTNKEVWVFEHMEKYKWILMIKK